MTTVFTLGPECSIAVNAARQLSVTWNNGHALNAVNGASVDYIPEFMRLAGVIQGGTFRYDMSRDMARMTVGQVSPMLALIIALIRKSVLSMDETVVNLVECHNVAAADAFGTIDEAMARILETHAPALQGIIKQSVSILGLNGLSMLSKGHNYIESDGMWSRLAAATKLDEHFEKLGVADWQGKVFHDALHPIDVDYKCSLVVAEDSPLIGHINGVVLKRLPGTPAGTALVSVARSAIIDIITLRPGCAAVLRPTLDVLNELYTRIMDEPLSWCVHFARAATARNLQTITRLEPNMAFIRGMAEELFARKSTILKSQAFRAVGSRYNALYAMGKSYAEDLEELQIDAAMVTGIMAPNITQARGILGGLHPVANANIAFPHGNMRYYANEEADMAPPARAAPAGGPAAADAGAGDD